MSCRSLLLSVVAVFAVSASAFAGDCNVPAPCGPATPSCEAPAPVCAPVCAPACTPICIPCINPFAVVRDAACTVVNAAANVQARLACLKPCITVAPCAPACVAPCTPACDVPAPCGPTCDTPAPCAPTCNVPEVKPCEPACTTAEPTCDTATCAPCAPVCAPVKVSCCIKPFQLLKSAFARPCFVAPACVAPCAPACEAPTPACAPVAPCTPATGC